MNKLTNLSTESRISSMILVVLVSFALASSQARAEWTPEASYTQLTNSVAKWNPGVPLRNFRMVHTDGRLGPVLTNRLAVIPYLYPGDQLCVKSTLSSVNSKGPLNPHTLQCHPTGTN